MTQVTSSPAQPNFIPAPRALTLNCIAEFPHEPLMRAPEFGGCGAPKTCRRLRLGATAQGEGQHRPDEFGSNPYQVRDEQSGTL